VGRVKEPSLRMGIDEKILRGKGVCSRRLSGNIVEKTPSGDKERTRVSGLGLASDHHTMSRACTPEGVQGVEEKKNVLFPHQKKKKGREEIIKGKRKVVGATLHGLP